MKSKESPNLYEILRAASRTSVETAPPEPSPAAPACGPHEPTLQERLAIYKAAKLGLAGAVPSPAAPAAAAAPAEVAPSESPAAALSNPVASARGPGERVLRITYNTAAFAALIGIGLLFVAYSLGVRAGRSGAREIPAEMTRPPALAAPANRVEQAPAKPAPAPRVYAIRLAEWPYRTAQDHLKAGAAAEDARKALARAGLAGAEAVQVTRGREPRLALYLGRYADVSSSSARSALSAAQKVRVQNQIPFAQAQFEEIPR